MLRQLPPTAPERFGVFTAGEAATFGWTPTVLRTAVIHQRIVRIRQGMYVDADRWHAEPGPKRARRRLVMRTVAALLAVGTAAASHTASAVLAGLATWEIPERPCMTVTPRFTGDTRDAHLHRATFTPQHLVPDAPVRRLRCARTVLDIAREHGVEDAIVVGDHALREGMVDTARLAAEAEFCAGWPGIRRAIAVLRMLDPRSESPLESVSRYRLAQRGLPEPDLQPEILTTNGRSLGWLDFYWDEFGVAGEVDGRLKYVDDPLGAVLREKNRQGPMEEVGLIFTRWGRGDIENMPLLESRLRDVYARGARRPRSDRAYVVRPTDPANLAPGMRPNWRF